MTDYLRATGRGWRVFSIVLCIVGVLMSYLFTVLGVCMFLGVPEPSSDDESRYLGLGVGVFFGLLGTALLWIAIRLIRGTTSNDGVTTMPTWFIQAFGWFFVAGSALAVWQKRYLQAAETVAMGLTMVFIGRRFRRKHQASNAVFQPISNRADAADGRG